MRRLTARRLVRDRPIVAADPWSGRDRGSGRTPRPRRHTPPGVTLKTGPALVDRVASPAIPLHLPRVTVEAVPADLRADWGHDPRGADRAPTICLPISGRSSRRMRQLGALRRVESFVLEVSHGCRSSSIPTRSTARLSLPQRRRGCTTTSIRRPSSPSCAPLPSPARSVWRNLH